jgi:MFS family permease
VVLRAIVGLGCAGIFVTTESWLSAKAMPTERGRVFAIYMVGTFLALALGQLLIARTDIKAAAPFNTIVTLFSVALIMVSSARAEAPRVSTAAELPYGVLAKAAPVAVVGCALSGLVGGAFYAVVPAWIKIRAPRERPLHCLCLWRCWVALLSKYRSVASTTDSIVALCWHCSILALR